MDGMKPGRIVLGAASLQLSYSALVPANLRGHVLEVTELLTSPQERRDNHANSLMQDVCEQADLHNKHLLLMPEAYGSGGLTTAQLTAWYIRKFGFIYLQQSPKVILIRPPRPVAAPTLGSA